MTRTYVTAVLVLLAGVGLPTTAFAADPPKPTFPAPLKPAAGDDAIRELSIKRYNALLQFLTLESLRRGAGAFTGSDFAAMCDATRSFIDLHVELETDARRSIEGLEGVLAEAKKWEEYYKERVRIGQDRPQAAALAESFRLEVEIRLLKAKRGRT